MLKLTFKSVIILIWGSLTISCAPTKQAAYFRTYKEIKDINEPDRVYYSETDQNNRIQPGDKLFITVSSGSSEPNSFNQPGGGALGDVELLSYEVDGEGYIKLPYLKRMKVEGLTINQATDTLESELSQYIYLPTVSIHFAISRITVLGEVNSPGVYEFNSKSINIYQAIAYASDISLYGNRKNVMIVRREGDNIMKKKVDLTNDEIISSKWYNIYSNDIIYVEPLKRKGWGIETFPYDLLFSLLSTFILMFTFVNSRPL